RLADVFRAKGDLGGAIGAYRKAIKVQPDLGYHRPTLASYCLHLADALRTRGDLKGAGAALARAITIYRKAIDHDPKNSDNYYSLGKGLLEAKGEPVNDILAAYRKVLELYPRVAIVHCGLGMALWGKGDKPGALRAIRWALYLDPNCVPAHTFLVTNLPGGDVEAIASYEKLIELEPTPWPPHFNNLAQALRTKGYLDRAIAVYRKGIQRLEDAGRANPALKAHALNRYSLYEGLAPALQAIGDPTEAIPFYRKLIERTPNNSQRSLDLGGALLQTKGQPA